MKARKIISALLAMAMTFSSLSLTSFAQDVSDRDNAAVSQSAYNAEDVEALMLEKRQRAEKEQLEAELKYKEELKRIETERASKEGIRDYSQAQVLDAAANAEEVKDASALVENKLNLYGNYIIEPYSYYNKETDTTYKKFSIEFYIGNEENVVIPAKIGEYAISYISSYAFDEKNMKSVVIPEGVTSIYSFNDCPNLTSVTLPSTVTFLGGFSNCDSLEEITLPGSLTYFWGLEYCDNLKKVVFRDGTDGHSIYVGGLYDCPSLETLVFPKNANIGWACTNCENLKNITFGEGTTSISGFYNCAIEKLDIPASVTKINGFQSWSGHSSISSITGGEGLTSIEGTGFYSTPFAVNSEKAAYLGKVLLTCGTDNVWKDFSVKAGTEEIADYAFTKREFNDYGNISVTYSHEEDPVEITLPSSLKRIGSNAFCGVNVAEITLPSKLEKIGSSAFYGTRFEEINFPSSLTEIGSYAFDNTPFYENLPDGEIYLGNVLYRYKGTMPESYELNVKKGTTYISGSAFEDYSGKFSNLISVSIPSSVKEIGDYAFRSCTNLSKVTFSEGLKVLGYAAFRNTALTSIVLPEGLEEIEGYCFENCGILSKVVMPSTLIRLGSNMFNNCSSLKSLTIPSAKNSSSAYSYSSGAFDGLPENFILYLHTDSQPVFISMIEDGYIKNYKFLDEYTETTFTVEKPLFIAISGTNTASVYYTNPNVQSSNDRSYSPDKYVLYRFENGKFTKIDEKTTYYDGKPFKVTGLTGGKTYQFLVRAYYKDYSSIVSVNDVVSVKINGSAIPEKPVVTVKAGNNCATLAWSKVDTATSYKIYKYDDGKYSALGTTSSTSYIVSDLENGTNYGFLVRAFNDKGGSTFNDADVVFVIPEEAVPDKPVVKAAAGDKQVTLSWTAAAGATSYTIYKYENGAYSKVTSTADTSYTVKGLTNGTTYKFLVRAFNSKGGSAFTTADLVSATPVAPVPSKPTNVKAAAGDKQVTLSWTASTDATSYTIYKYENGAYTKINSTTKTTYTVTGLTNGTTYKFLVRAFNANGGNSFTTADLVSATPKAAAATAPAKPTVSANVQDKVVTFSWNAVSGATYYKLYNYSNGKYGLIATVTDTTYRLRYLKNGTTYQVLVRAFNEKGGSKFTTADLITVTPKTAAAVPDKPVVTATVSGGNVNLTWAHVPTAFSYTIYKYENGTYTKLGATCDNYFTVKGLAAGKTYSILVRAFNSKGGHKVTSGDRVSVTL